jgi:hypothetical protein
MTIDVAVVLVGLVLISSSCPLGMSLPLLLYARGRGYNEGNRVGYNMILIRTLSLLDYFTYIFIDIIIYAWGSTTWSSGIFWMVGHSRPLLWSSESMWGGTPGTNPRQQPPSAWQVSRC